MHPSFYPKKKEKQTSFEESVDRSLRTLPIASAQNDSLNSSSFLFLHTLFLVFGELDATYTCTEQGEEYNSSKAASSKDILSTNSCFKSPSCRFYSLQHTITANKSK